MWVCVVFLSFWSRRGVMGWRWEWERVWARWVRDLLYEFSVSGEFSWRGMVESELEWVLGLCQKAYNIMWSVGSQLAGRVMVRWAVARVAAL